MSPACFACNTITPAYRFAGRLLCGDCAGDGGVLYREERPGTFVLEFARRELIAHLITFESAHRSPALIGQVARRTKLGWDADLERITRGCERLVTRADLADDDRLTSGMGATPSAT